MNTDSTQHVDPAAERAAKLTPAALKKLRHQLDDPAFAEHSVAAPFVVELIKEVESLRRLRTSGACENCGGTGWWTRGIPGGPGQCPSCNGTGVRGQRL